MRDLRWIAPLVALIVSGMLTLREWYEVRGHHGGSWTTFLLAASVALLCVGVLAEQLPAMLARERAEQLRELERG